MKHFVKAPTRGHDSFSSVSLREGKGEFKRVEEKEGKPQNYENALIFSFPPEKNPGRISKNVKNTD